MSLYSSYSSGCVVVVVVVIRRSLKNLRLRRFKSDRHEILHKVLQVMTHRLTELYNAIISRYAYA